MTKLQDIAKLIVTKETLMKSYKLATGYRTTGLTVNTSKEGETIEAKMERVINNKEPIKDGAPIIYTERKEGVRASTNIRTDRWEIALDATDKIAKSYKARREEKEKAKPKDGEAESIQGKESKESTEKPQ